MLFRSRANCGGGGRRRHPVVAHRFVGGTGGNEVWLYEVVDGGHSWAEKDMDTSEEIWRFFGRFVK